MTNPLNLYAPPDAVVEDVNASAGGSTSAVFFAVSIRKLCVLSLCTMGLYGTYWFYKNWQLIRDHERSDILPAPRALFGFFYCYSCFKRVRDFDLPSVQKQPLPAGALAAGWVFCQLLSRLPNAYALLSLLAFGFLIPVQMQANQINASLRPGHDRNERLTAWNWLFIALGLILTALAAMGLSVPSR